MLPPDAARWVLPLVSAVFGGAIGSFLNVVIYRLPNGISLITPPSHCPVCKKPIRWFDNVPVLGWIMLGGRCRDCRTWISMRYPIVEAVTAAMFAAVAVVQSPGQPAYACFVLLLCTLLCAALMEVDRDRPPLKLFLPAMIVGAVAPFVTACPRLVATWSCVSIQPSTDIRGIVTFELAVAVFFAVEAWLLSRKTVASSSSETFFWSILCVGLLFGWLTVGIVGLAVVPVHFALFPLRRAFPSVRIPFSMLLFVAVLVWILA